MVLWYQIDAIAALEVCRSALGKEKPATGAGHDGGGFLRLLPKERWVAVMENGVLLLSAWGNGPDSVYATGSN